MSQQHIPQPNSQSAAPAEVFDSTADAPHGQTVSALGTPGPRPGEVIVHTGQKNSIDFSIHRQFVPIDTFIWSTSQPRGTLLWSSPVHPSRVNPLVDYISEIYNTWGGGIEYNFKCAGTGFHAGALAFVRIPPNFHPSQFTTPTEWGAFEYVVMDPKTLEVLSLDVMDQRPLNFHFMKLDEQNPLTFGGYICCFVLIPLNTSSTGTQQIAVQAFGRPGATFTMNQIVMPGIKDVPEPVPILLPTLLDVHGETQGCQSLSPLKYLRTGTAGRYYTVFIPTIDGQIRDNVYGRGEFEQSWDTRVTVTNVSGSLKEDATMKVTCVMDRNARFAAPAKENSFYLVGVTNPEASVGAPQAWTLTKVTYNSRKYLQLNADIQSSTGSTIAIGNAFKMVPIVAWARNFSITGFDDDDKFLIPVPDEVMLTYVNSDASDSVSDLATLNYAKAAIEGKLKGLFTKSGCIFLDLIDNATSLNLMTVKLYHEGVMTVSRINASKLIKDPFHFVFNGYGNRTSIIPTTPAQLVNMLLLSSSLPGASDESLES